MTETRFTPGPWEVHYSDEGQVWVQECDPSRGHKIICDIPGDMETIESEELADADLIAAAPDLLQVVIDALPVLDDAESDARFKAKTDAKWEQVARSYKLQADHARAMIAKARGESQ